MVKSKAYIFITLLVLFFVSCKKNINLYDALFKRGYTSNTPLTESGLKVDDHLTGAYLLGSSNPVLIEKKTSNSYKVTFLQTGLYDNNIVLDAHVSKIGSSSFLNITNGSVYAFMKFKINLDNSVNVGLLKSGLKKQVKPDKLKSWLLENHDKATYEHRYTYRDSITRTSTNQIYYDFKLSKTTKAYALKIQADKKEVKKEYAFKRAKTRKDYYKYAAAFPGDPDLEIILKNILDRCTDLEDLDQFLVDFPKSKHVKNAEAKREFILEEIKARKEFEALVAKNDVQLYDQYIQDQAHSIYVDSAKTLLMTELDKIGQKDIEWKWTDGKRDLAFKWLQLKIDYDSGIAKQWYKDHLVLYAAKMENPEREIAIDKLFCFIDKTDNKNFVTEVYADKAILLWMIDKQESAIELVRMKALEDENIKGLIKSKLKQWTKQGTQVEGRKSFWKKIKKF